MLKNPRHNLTMHYKQSYVTLSLVQGKVYGKEGKGFAVQFIQVHT